MLRTRIFAAATASILALGMSVGGAGAAFAQDPADLDTGDSPGDVAPLLEEEIIEEVPQNDEASDTDVGCVVVIWEMPSWVSYWTPTWPQTLVSVHESDCTTTPISGADFPVPDDCGTQYQLDKYHYTERTADMIGRGVLVGYGDEGSQVPGTYGTLVKNADCVVVAPAVTTTPENCLDGEGTMTFLGEKGLIYSVEGVEGTFGPNDVLGSLVAGDYEVTVTVEPGFVLDGESTFTVTVESTEIDCVLDVVEINPMVDVSPFDCVLGGAFTIPDIDGVMWMVDGEAVEPGEHVVALADTTVSVTALIDPERDDVTFAEGAVTQWELSFPEPEGGCLDTFPLVEPDVSVVMPTCDVMVGTYTLSDTEGVTWFVNDSERAAGSYESAVGTTVSIRAVADDGYGFGDEQATEWTTTFVAPTGCADLADLDTLALTGTNGTLVNGGAYLAIVVTLAGIAMVAARRRAEV